MEQGCSLGLDVSVSRPTDVSSRTHQQMSRSRLRLEAAGLGSRLGLSPKGLVGMPGIQIPELPKLPELPE